MPRSQISLAKLESGPEGDRIRVEGPLVLEQEEDDGMGGVPPESSVVLLTVYVVLAKRNAYAHGPQSQGGGRVDLELGWTAHAVPEGDAFVVGDIVLATGLLVFVDRGKGGDVPIPQTFSWTEEVGIT